MAIIVQCSEDDAYFSVMTTTNNYCNNDDNHNDCLVNVLHSRIAVDY